jgi:predicted metal-dependent hydrolase
VTQPSSVRFGDTTIEYQVRRSQRRKKTVQITVDGAGVQVAAPVATPDDEIQAMVRKRAPWILRNAADAQLVA